MFLAFFDNVKKFANQYFQYFDFINIVVYLLRAFVYKTGLKEVFIFNFHPFDWKKAYVHIILI